ncbi:MAG TPA: hypothetical protein VGD66_09590 [Allosphingosinicella sp.]|jgi:hypothetical protein
MKMVLTAMTAVSALALAAPAAAQYGYQTNSGYANGYGYNAGANANASLDTRIASLQTRLDAGISAGTIDRREAASLRRQLDDLRRLEWRYSRNGLTQQERMDLQLRIRSVRQQLRTADNGGWDRYDRYGYDDRDYYNNGATNGYSGQGGPYEDVACDSRGGLGGLVNGLLGRDNCGGLGVGARVTGNLGAVPYEYRDQYRDGSGYYYRSDGRAIYQIDTRTNTVARVYPMGR